MGYKIKEKREAMNMTQEQLANASGVSRITIALLESGTTKNASSKTLLNIARALNTTIDDLFFNDCV